MILELYIMLEFIILLFILECHGKVHFISVIQLKCETRVLNKLNAQTEVV